MDEDSSTKQKTWQVYSFGKRNVFRLHLSESAFHPVWPIPLCSFPQGRVGQGSRCLVVYTNCSSWCVLFLWQQVPSKHAWSHCQYGQRAARIRLDLTSGIRFGSVLPKKARIIMCNLPWRTWKNLKTPNFEYSCGSKIMICSCCNSMLIVLALCTPPPPPPPPQNKTDSDMFCGQPLLPPYLASDMLSLRTRVVPWILDFEIGQTKKQ